MQGTPSSKLSWKHCPLRRHIPSPEISIMPAFSMSRFRQHGHYPPSLRYSFIACTFAGCFWQSASMRDSRPMSEPRSRQKSGPCTNNNRLGQAESSLLPECNHHLFTRPGLQSSSIVTWTWYVSCLEPSGSQSVPSDVMVDCLVKKSRLCVKHRHGR